jgi:hypothetical protein
MNTLRKSQLKKLIKEEFQAQSHDFNTMEANKLLNNILHYNSEGGMAGPADGTFMSVDKWETLINEKPGLEVSHIEHNVILFMDENNIGYGIEGAVEADASISF